MKIRRIKLLIANGWFKTVCMVSYSLLSLFCSNASAQEKKDTPYINMDSVVANLDKLSMDSINALLNGIPINNLYIQERNQGMRARAYGPQYPRDNKPLLVLDGRIVDLLSVDTQCLDSLVSGELQMEKENIARLFGIKERDIKNISLLKDAASIAIWGQRGANGVIEVRTKHGSIIKGRDDDPNRYAWESINEEIQKEYSKTELDSLPGNGLYIPSDHATYYSIEDFYNNWILK